MAVNYKTLFEVKVLHEYYLTNKDGSTIFDEPLQADRLAFLLRKASLNAPSIHECMSFELPEAIKNTFKNFKLHLSETYSGFKILAAVKKKNLAGGEQAFHPEVELPDNLPITIGLSAKGPELETITNSPVKNALPAGYYFTNRDLGETRVYPFLASNLPIRNDALDYEQGELAVDPADDLSKAFFFEKNSTPNWIEVKANGCANRNDLALLPIKFNYRFFQEDGEGQANFTLKDDTTTFLTLNHTVSGSKNSALLDFSSVNPVIFDGKEGSNLKTYSLEVTLNNGSVRVHRVIFCSPELKQANAWGMAHLQPRVADSAFNLLDDDGLLITRVNADGTKVSHPIFEIRIKSRFVFWKYTNHKNEPILDNAALHPYLAYDSTGGFFETKKMLNASRSPIEFSNQGSPQFLPNPDRELNLANENRRVYVNIRVPVSPLFKV